MALAWGVASIATAAHAGPPRTIRIVGEERGCPTPGQVSGLLAPLLPGSRISATSGSASADDVTLSDDGPSFRVVAAGQERSFVDPVRECLDRARHAAVFVALALDPPAISTTSTTPKPPASERPEPPIEPLPRRPASHLDLELGGLLLSAPGSAGRSATRPIGIAARARWGRELGVTGGVAFLPGELAFRTVDTRLLWFPLDLGVELNIRSASLEIGGELGPAVTVFGILGENLVGARRQWRADVGGRAALKGRAWINGSFGLFASAQVSAFARPYDLKVDPAGQGSDVGATPWLWWGGSIGIFSRIE
jgi:hypothetical protein